MASRKGRMAVYLASVPADWRPQRVWDWPPEFGAAKLQEKNLTPPAAISFARVHNMEQMRANQHERRPIVSWAIVCRHLRPCWRNRQPQGENGGAV